jgi:hypothetical protein
MVGDSNPVAAVVSAVQIASRTVRRTVRAFDDRFQVWIRDLSHRGRVGYTSALLTAMVAVGVHLVGVLLPALVGRAAAQSAGQAEEIMCETGAGDAVTLLFGGLALLLLVVAAVRLTSGLNKKGSQRSDKKREGDEQLKGAGYSVGGVFALTAFPLILEQIGLATISCVEFAPF